MDVFFYITNKWCILQVSSTLTSSSSQVPNIYQLLQQVPSQSYELPPLPRFVQIRNSQENLLPTPKSSPRQLLRTLSGSH